MARSLFADVSFYNGIKMQATVYQILNVSILIIPILALIICRVYFPNRFWLGMVLSILLFPIGHFYIKKGFYYVVIIWINISLLSMIIDNEIAWVIVVSAISAFLMFFRFKLSSIRKIEQES